MLKNKIPSFVLAIVSLFLLLASGCGESSEKSDDPEQDESPCKGITCDNHGECIVVGGLAECDCDDGYHAVGLSCVEGDCEGEACCEGVACGDNGTCKAIDNTPVCVCDDGYHAENMVCVEGTDCEDLPDISGVFAIEAIVKVNMVINIESKQHFLVAFEQDGSNIKTTTISCTIDLPSYPGIAEITVPEAARDIIESQVVETEGDYLLCETYDPPDYATILGADLSAGDPMTDPLPDIDNPDTASDDDADDKPGITLQVKTALCGEDPVDIYVAIRTVVDLKGTVMNTNTIFGDPGISLEWSILGYSDDCLEMAGNLEIIMMPDNTFIARRIDGKHGSVDLDADDDGEVSCEEFMPNIDQVFGE